MLIRFLGYFRSLENWIGTAKKRLIGANCDSLCVSLRFEGTQTGVSVLLKLVLAVRADYFGAMLTEARVVSQSIRSVQAAPL